MRRSTYATIAVFSLSLLLLSAPQAALIHTTVTATVNGFNPGPYSGGAPITIDFDWVSGTARDWGTGTASYFDTAVDNIVINVGGHIITGTDAQVVQHDNTLDDQVRITFGTYLGTPYGTVGSAPDYNGAAFEALRIVFRDATNSLFASPLETHTLISAPNAGLYVDSVTLYFSGSDVLNPYDRQFTMTGSEASVPVPGIAALIAPLLPWLRRRHQG
ncbi:MAG: hypothetical protein H6980_03665 [Gammaproteobacteria bacterium]|nr:hypothetical protein [Gammaproteobacteria bacterium]